MFVASACSGSGSPPAANVYEYGSGPSEKDSEANWARYKAEYADRELEIASGMVDEGADSKIEPVNLIDECEAKLDRVVRLDHDGDVIWSQDMPRCVHSVRPPAWSRQDGYVFVVQYPGLAALDDKTGDILWESDGPHDRLFSIGKLIIAGDCNSSPAGGRWAVARHADTGAIAWKIQLPDDMEPYKITSYGDLIWILCNDFPYSATYVVDLKGNLIAKFDEYVTDVRVVGTEFIFASNKRIARMNHRADILWQAAYGPDNAWPFSNSVMIAGPGDDLLAYFYTPISDSGVEVWRLNPQNGKVVWKAECENLGVPHSIYSQNVYLKVKQDEVVVVSKGSWMFVEVLSANTGKHLDRFEFAASFEE